MAWKQAASDLRDRWMKAAPPAEQQLCVKLLQRQQELVVPVLKQDAPRAMSSSATSALEPPLHTAVTLTLNLQQSAQRARIQDPGTRHRQLQRCSGTISCLGSSGKICAPNFSLKAKKSFLHCARENAQLLWMKGLRPCDERQHYVEESLNRN